MSLRGVLLVSLTVLIATAFLIASPKALAQDARGYRPPDPPYPDTKLLPWNLGTYQGYQLPSRPPSSPAAPHTAPTPQKYTLQVTVLPQKNEEDPNTALMIAHLPEDARIWFEGQPTQQIGVLRRFFSPPLTPGKSYRYTIRVQWPENDQWVSQIHNFSVHAGDIHCIDVIPTESRAVEQAVAKYLAKLDPEDRKAAEVQRFCAVQEGIRLGSMGVPVKVTVKGQPVFLCCKGCEAKAQAEPDRTMSNVRKIKAEKTGSSSP
jgi:uncharacterized protein (TIGR03000 family)